jgi:hypothetical protein
MIVYGRKNYSGSKCIKCNASVSAFGQEWISREGWTWQKLNDEVENYYLANNATLQLQSGKTQEGIAAIIEKSRADFAKSGITDKAPLFVYWDMRNI